MSLARLRHEDVPRCAELERLLFPEDDPWSERAFHSELDGGHFYLGGYLADGRLVGYAGLAVVAGPPAAEAEVHTIGVDPAWQGRGVGRALLAVLMEQADAISATVYLEVRTDNRAAIGLYVAHGFQEVGIRKRYYQPSGADAYVMRRLAVKP
ncbi:ribosomal-protein-alanine N-acetyltransferase [Pseudonocardiaceae bacterium YIM PH 21723]|nr:ribosomal-protein-alanine N-acetyltransferase [Pseudonocardiaceae bacterium YIM PH 21723]